METTCVPFLYIRLRNFQPRTLTTRRYQALVRIRNTAGQRQILINPLHPQLRPLLRINCRSMLIAREINARAA